MRRTLPFLVLAATLVPTGSALAARAPTRAERRALVTAAVCLDTAGYCRNAVVQRVRVSTRGPYALVALGARPGSDYQNNTALLRGRNRRWHIVAIISGEGVPCSVPVAVRRDLDLARYSASGSKCA
jgi:hypothetical protein